MSSMTPPSEYVLEPLREGAEFALYRGRQHGKPSPVLVVAPTAEQPLPQSLRRLEHEYSLAAELEPAWAAMPLALTRHEGRTILVLADPGGEPLDRENKDCPSFVTRKRQRHGRPRGLKFGCERVFVFKASQTLGQRLLCGRSYYQEGRRVAVLSGTVEREFRVIADWLEHVLRSSCH